MKKIVAKVLIMAELLSVFALAACSPVPKYYSKSEVLEYMDEICPSEKYEYTITKGRDVDGVKQIIYECSSKERDLDFEVISGSEENTFDGGSIPFTWHPCIKDTYLYNIRKYYVDDYEDIFDEYKDEAGMYFNRSTSNYEYLPCVTFRIDDYEEIEIVASFCAELSKVYSAEHEYNSWDWMDMNPLFEIRVFSNNATDYSALAIIGINGADDYDDYYKLMSNNYIQQVYDGSIEDDTITDFTGFHKTKLQVYVDGDIPEKEDFNFTNVNPYEPEQFVAKYDYETDEYYLPITLTVSKTCSPNLIEFYVDKADGTIIKSTSRYTKFEIGSKTYVFDLDLDGNNIEDFDIKKNGKKYKVEMLDKTYEGQYVFWFSVEDMADMFDFDYEIDEKASKININF
ncbi:MAG: hypothetical protein MJ166_07145 [Clostridia bacterium]|nr:hypothetical protein [Clostridia bacterium]